MVDKHENTSKKYTNGNLSITVYLFNLKDLCLATQAKTTLY